MKKKVIAILLVFCMSAGFITGCGNNVNIQQETDTAETVEIEMVKPINDEYRNFYQIFPGSYYDSDGDGSGDLAGIIEKLDYIEEMGFNGIWLTPIMPSPTYHKYDVTDYYEIDPAFGTMDDYKKLVEECHDRDIRLIIDMVFNHTSSEHPWFQEAVSYLESLDASEEPDLTACPYVGYYHFVKEGEQGVNWYQAGNSDYYYEGVFWSGMPDLALENEAVRKEFEDIAKFWLDMGTDGFRLDAAKEYYTGYAQKNIEVLSWYTQYVKSLKPDAYLVAEVWEGQSSLTEYYASGIDSLFNFPAATQEGAIMKTARGRVDMSEYVSWMIRRREQDLEKNPNYIDAPFISNHDTTRISAQAVSDEAVMKFSAGLLLTMQGSPFVYYGEEIGMKSMGDKDENKRLPMYWSVSNTEGMTNPPADADEVEQKFAPWDEQKDDPQSILNYYKNAMRIRNSYPEIARGDVSFVEGEFPEGCAASMRSWNEETCVIMYCNGEEGVSVDLAALGLSEYELKDSLTVSEEDVFCEGDTLKLPYGSIAILK